MRSMNDKLTRKLWSTVLKEDLFMYMTNATDEDGEPLEGKRAVYDFFEHVENRLLFGEVMSLAKSWDKLDGVYQVKCAIDMCGEYHASRFMMMMDYFNEKGVD